MNTNNHIDPEDLTLYAMQLLGETTSLRIEEHLSECGGCAEVSAQIRGDLAALALTVELQSPPAAARQRLLTQIAREKKIVPVDRSVHAEAGSPLDNRIHVAGSSEVQSIRTAKILPWVSWVGWAVAACLTVAATDLYRERDDLRAAVAHQATQMAALSSDAAKGRALMSALTDQSAMRVTLTQTSAKPVPQGRASYIPEKGSLLFTASNLEPLQPFKTYELWLIPADGTSPVPAGTFLPDGRGNASLIMPDLPKGIVAKAFGITIENQGGSQQPTLPIVMAGA